MNCEACGKPLPPGVRRSRRFCDDTCRKRARRGRPSVVLADVAAQSRHELTDRPPLDGDADKALARLRDTLWDALDGEETGAAKASLGRELRMVITAIEERRAAADAARPRVPSKID